MDDSGNGRHHAGPRAEDARLDDGQSALVRLWHRRRGGQRWPARAEFEIDDLRAVIGRVALIDVDHAAPPALPVLRYRLFGTWLVHEIGQDLTGLTVDALELDWQRDMVRRVYGRLLESGRPVAALRRQIGTERSMGHGLVALPLGTDRIDMILTAYAALPSTPTDWRGPWQAGERYELHQWVFEVGDDGALAAAAFAHDGVVLGAEDVPKRSSPVPGATGVPACRVRVRKSRRL